MIVTVIITRDNQPRSFRWGLRAGVNQPNDLGLSRAEANPGKARRSAERLFGPLEWRPAGNEVDERNQYVVEYAVVTVAAADLPRH